MKLNYLMIPLVIAGLLLISGCNTKKISLVKDGESEYSIVIPENPTKSEKRAAELLQKYIEEISECRLDIISMRSGISNAIYIQEKGERKYDGYSISTGGESVYIDGSLESKGCVYGVVTLLESYLGVRLYSPEFRIIPKSTDISLPYINIADFSINKKRFVNYWYGEYAGDLDLLDFNRLTPDPSGIASHSYSTLVPPEKFFSSHPEYYAFRDGKRLTSQLCLSNPGTLEAAIATLRRMLENNPEIYYLNVAQNDDQKYCMCDECMRVLEEEGNPSGSVIRFANSVAKAFPDRMILTYAYNYSRSAPKKVKPLSNVQVTLCTIELDRSRPIEEDTSFQARSFLRDIVEWGQISENIYLWDYTINFHNYLCPFPNIHVRQPNIRFFTRNNVFNHFQQSNAFQGVEFADLKLYLTSRLLWNPELDMEAAMDKFLKEYYGSAAPWIKKYIKQMETELLRSGKRLDIFEPLLAHQDGYLSEKNINDYCRYFDKAEEAVKNDQQFLRNVELARLPLIVAMLETGKYNILGSRGWFEDESAARNTALDNELEKFYRVAKKESINHMNEQQYTPEQYYHSIKRATDIDYILKGNYALHKEVKASPVPNIEVGYGLRDISHLTDAVLGDDYSHEYLWVGWQGTDFELLLDLEDTVHINSVELNTFWRPNQWERVLHPRSIECFVSGSQLNDYISVGKQEVLGDQLNEVPINKYHFNVGESLPECRYVKLKISATVKMPDEYIDCAGQPSNVMIDEIVVR